MEVVNDEAIIEAIIVDTFPDGEAVNLEAIFGSSISYGADGKVAEASAMSQVRTASRGMLG